MVSSRDGTNTPIIAVLGFLGAVGVFALILALEVLYYHVEARQEYRKDISQPVVELSNLLQEQQARLETYRWVEEKKQIVAIPIGRAMRLVVDELSGQAEAKGGGHDR
jgi:hypothetical protein